MNAVLEVCDVVVTRSSKRLVDGVSIELYAGEVVALIGPNGAGKTTLLHSLAGALRPDAGSITLHGTQLTQFNPQTLAQQRALLTQHHSLSFALSALEVVMLGRYPHDEAPAASTAIAHAALAAVGIADLAMRNVHTLSGGEQTRVQCARVLAQLWGDAPPAKLLLLDEPTASLDLKHQQDLMQLVQGLAKRAPIAVLAIVHDLNLAARYADRVLLLREGRLLTQGTPHDVFTPENLKLGFGIDVTVITHPERGHLVIL